VLSNCIQDAVKERSEGFFGLVWGRKDSHFSIAVEATVPRDLTEPGWTDARFSVTFYLDEKSGEVKLQDERLGLLNARGESQPVIVRRGDRVEYIAKRDMQTGISERVEFVLGPGQLGLKNLPEDRTKYPAALWLRFFLMQGLVRVVLDNELLRSASPPGRGRSTTFDGFDLARLVAQLKNSHPERYESWLRHLRTALPDIHSIDSVYRPEDRYRYLVLDYRNGVKVPQWSVSDGTLRLLALTFLAYDVDTSGVFLIEEPEIGLHPAAIETVLQSLKSVYDGQVLVTTHSPLVVGLTTAEELLCFSMTDEGTKIVRGDEHPYLEDWRSGLNISDLFASGVLG
jgi:hypothetical protein